MAKKNMKVNRSLLLAVLLGLASFFVLFFVSQLSRSQSALRSKAALSFSSFGIMGDSNADEYRADNNRGGAYAATTLNWVEQVVRYRGLNFGRWSSWGGFRRTGYEYNFSLSGATTSSGLQAGAHTALGSLVQSGTVPFVFYSLGANDFAYYNSIFSQIYNGQLSGPALDAYVQQTVNNVATAIDTINASHKAKMLVSLIPDQTLSPAARAQFPDTTKIKRVSDAVKKANDGIRVLVSQRGYALFDVEAVSRRLLGSIDTQGNITIDGEKIAFTSSGDEPHHVILSDNIHAGTVFSGIYANEWITAVNAAFGTQIALFSDNDLLVHAGIRTATSTPVPSATSNPTISPTSSATTVPTAPPTVMPTSSPTASARPTASPTPRVTASPTAIPTNTAMPTPTPDPYAQYCSTYRRFRSLLIRFLSGSQISTWDARCNI